jgi:hypothetical protein
VGAAVAGQQAGPRADVRARQLEVPTALAGPLTAAAEVDVTAVAMPLDPGLGEIGHVVVFELAGRLEVGGTAMGAQRGVDVVLGELRARRRLGPESPGVLAVFLAAVIGTSGLRGPGAAARSLAPLTDLLELVLQLRQAAAQLRVLRFQFSDPLSKLLLAHGGWSLPSGFEPGKLNYLTVTAARPMPFAAPVTNATLPASFPV